MPETEHRQNAMRIDDMEIHELREMLLLLVKDLDPKSDEPPIRLAQSLWGNTDEEHIEQAKWIITYIIHKMESYRCMTNGDMIGFVVCVAKCKATYQHLKPCAQWPRD